MANFDLHFDDGATYSGDLGAIRQTVLQNRQAADHKITLHAPWSGTTVDVFLRPSDLYTRGFDSGTSQFYFSDEASGQNGTFKKLPYTGHYSDIAGHVENCDVKISQQAIEDRIKSLAGLTAQTTNFNPYKDDLVLIVQVISEALRFDSVETKIAKVLDEFGSFKVMDLKDTINGWSAKSKQAVPDPDVLVPCL